MKMKKIDHIVVLQMIIVAMQTTSVIAIAEVAATMMMNIHFAT